MLGKNRNATRTARSSRRRKIISFLALSFGAWLLSTVVRSRHLLAQGRIIAQQSRHFERDYFVGDAARPTLTYLVMGDSTAAGWGAESQSQTYPYQVAEQIAARGYRVHVVVVAHGGARLRDVLADQLPTLQALRPQVVTLSVGANDATHFTPKDEWKRELEILLSALGKSQARRILIADTPDLYQAPALPLPLAVAVNTRARQQNQLLQAALRGSSARRVPLYARGKLIYRRDPNLYAADLFHPSSLGYRVWAQLFQSALTIEKVRPNSGVLSDKSIGAAR